MCVPFEACQSTAGSCISICGICTANATAGCPQKSGCCPGCGGATAARRLRGCGGARGNTGGGCRCWMPFQAGTGIGAAALRAVAWYI